MKMTPLSFVSVAEGFLGDALRAAAPLGGMWSFQRFINPLETSCSLQISYQSLGAPMHVVGIVYAVASMSHEPCIQGWMQLKSGTKRMPFVVRDSSLPRMEEEIYGLTETWSNYFSSVMET